ncbi:O-antigen polymerase [Vibrio owensii]
MASFWFQFKLIYACIIILCLLGINYTQSDINLSVYLTLSFLLLYGFQKIIEYKKGGSFFTADFFIVTMFSLFHFSYLILHFFNLAEYDKEVYYFSDYASKALYFSLMCISSFLIGYSFFNDLNGTISKDCNLDNRTLTILYSISKLLIHVAVVMLILPLLSAPQVFTDYKLLLNLGSLSPIGKLYWLSQYVAYIGISLYFVSKFKLGVRFFAGKTVYVIAVYALFYILIGDRGVFLSYFVVFLICINYYHKKISPTWLLSLFLLLACISAVLAVTRVESIYNPINMASYYIESSSSDENPLLKVLIEFGTSIKTVNIVMGFIPEQYDFWYGKSLIDSFLITLPSIFATRTAESSIGAWVTVTAFGPLSYTYGRGGSIAMESYMNFGVYGSIFFFAILGLIISRFFRGFYLSSSITRSVLFLSSLPAISMWMRNTSSVSFRIVLWSLFFTLLAILLSKSLRKKNNLFTR